MRSEGAIGSLDWSVVLIYLILIGLGWFNIFASVYDSESTKSIFDLSINSGKQLLWIATSFVLIAIILIVDFRIYESLAPVLYIIFVGLLMAVLVFGKEINGAKAWFEFGAFRLQPAELTKFATALLLARYVSGSGVKLGDFKSQLIAMAIMFSPVALIMLQPEPGLSSDLLFFYAGRLPRGFSSCLSHYRPFSGHHRGYDYHTPNDDNSYCHWSSRLDMGAVNLQVRKKYCSYHCDDARQCWFRLWLRLCL